MSNHIIKVCSRFSGSEYKDYKLSDAEIADFVKFYKKENEEPNLDTLQEYVEWDLDKEPNLDILKEYVEWVFDKEPNLDILKEYVEWVLDKEPIDIDSATKNCDYAYTLDSSGTTKTAIEAKLKEYELTRD